MHSVQTLRPTERSLFSVSLKAPASTSHQSYIRGGRSSWPQTILTTGSTQQNRDHTSACGIPCQLALHQHAAKYALPPYRKLQLHGVAETPIIGRNPFTHATHEKARQNQENSEARTAAAYLRTSSLTSHPNTCTAQLLASRIVLIARVKARRNRPR
jgi:hypothetical protein